VLYVTMHQVGILCGVLGVMGLLSFHQWGVPERYQSLLILMLSALALTPWVIILVFLIAGNRSKPLLAWFDEKQATDTAVGALCAMLAAMPAMVVLSSIDLYFKLGLPLSFWMMLLFFLCLLLFSLTVLARRGVENPAES
jgi:hypothetical protein